MRKFFRNRRINKENKGLKILHILSSNEYSGAENVAITIIEEMNKKSINCIYASPKGPIQQKLETENIEFVPIEKLNIKEIRKIYKKYKPDIIHAHDFTTSVLTSFSGLNCKIISHLHHNGDWIKKINLKSIIYLISSIKYKKIILVSNAIFEEYIFSKFIKNKIEILGNPINCNEIIKKATENEKLNEKFDLIFVGRLEYEKDPLRFIDIVEKTCTKTNIKTAIIGDGSLKEECKKKIELLNLSNNIKMLGFLNNPYSILKNAKILCITSRWEGFGLVAVEALTLGKPVVANNVGGLPQIVDDTCGKLCNNNDEFCEEIIHLINNSEYYNQKSKGAVDKAKQLDNTDLYMNKLFDIYRKE